MISRAIISVLPFGILLLSFGMFGQIQFSESAGSLGCVNSSYGSGSLGGGVSFFDFDQDGWDDLTLSSEDGQPLRFFKNDNGFFTEIDLGITNTYETKTAQWVDFDNDGDYDLFVTAHLDHNILYENNGQMQFTDITVASGLFIENHLTYGSSWGDYNNDGWLDVFIASHREISAGYHNMLYKNNGNGTFTDVSADAGILLDTYTSFCSSFFDYDKDGWQDIYVANDRSPVNHMYHNNGDGTFTEVGASTGTNFSIDAMSTTIDDPNNDGWLDIYVTNTGAGNLFLENNGDGTFTDLGHMNGTLMESVAWGAVFLDGENKGFKDLYVSAMIADPNVGLTSAYYLSDGTGLYSIPSGIGFDDDHAVSFGNAIGDINNDGLPDIAVINYAPNEMFLFKNESTPANNWIKVKLEGVTSNRQGIGSWIEISINGEKQYNYTLCGEGYLGQNSSYEFFGIGAATTIDYIKVNWLSGIEDTIFDPEINSHLSITEGETLEIEEHSLNSPFKMYPNPSNGSVTFNVSEILIGSELWLSDLMGRVLLTSEITAQESTFSFDALASGIYVVTLSGDGTRFSEKLILK
jgi:hypothetical protein